MERRILALTELNAIDQFRSRAYAVLEEARRHRASFQFDLAVRRAQEALELYIKSIFLFVGKEYPKTHDLEKQIYEISATLAECGITAQEVAPMVLANSTLDLWRLPSFYGDERLQVAKLFGREEADLAIAYVGKIQLICERVRSHFYRQLPKS